MFRRIRKNVTEQPLVEATPTDPVAAEVDSNVTAETFSVPSQDAGVSVASSTGLDEPQPSAAGPSRPRPSSKLAIAIGLLEGPEGASLARLVEVTGWLPHTTRAALTGLRKRGFAVTGVRVKGADGVSHTLYRIASAKAA